VQAIPVKAIRFSTPILAPLLSNRTLCRAIAGIAAVHLSLVALGLPSWPCPIRHGLGVPCPSCGLTRAIQALVVGNWQQAIAIHAFAPLAVIAVVLIGYAGVAPAGQRWRIIRYCRQVEQKTGLSILLVTLFLLYWLLRWFLFRTAFYDLVL
jgi:hypothetical protein